jgi:hypothetical protein
MHDMARLFVSNGFGFGKYWSGYIFGKCAKDSHFLYLADNKMAVLSAGIDEDGEKTILEAADSFTEKQLSRYFSLNFSKTSAIDWLETQVNVVLLCEKEKEAANNLIYFTWPAVKLNFTKTIQENTIVAYDRFASCEKLESLKEEAERKGIADRIEYWSMLKLLALSDRFGEFAPKVCMSAVPCIG